MKYFPAPGSGAVATPSVPEAYFLKKTTAQRLALTPSDGDIVYDTTLRATFQYVVDRWFLMGIIDPRCGTYWQEDFDNGNATTAINQWVQQVSGTGATVAARTALQTDMGKVLLQTGTTTTGRAAISRDVTSWLPGASFTSIMWRMKLSNLSTVGEEFSIYAGFGDVRGAGDQTDGVYFKYDRLTDGDFWSTNTASNTTRTKTVQTTVPDATAFNRYRIDIANALASFYVNDVLIGTNSTNLPTGAGRVSCPLFKIEKSAGTTDRFIDLDYCTFTQFFDARR
jgi:hypothetical protein